MITRRQFIQGLTATLASVALPKPEQQTSQPEPPKAIEGNDGQVVLGDGSEWSLSGDEETITPEHWTLTESWDWSGQIKPVWWDEPGDFPLTLVPLKHTPPSWSLEITLDFALVLGKEYPVEFSVGDMWWKGTALVIEIEHSYSSMKRYSLTGIGELFMSATPPV